MTNAVDGVLRQLAGCGPEFGPGLSNHGPMAVDALVALGRADVIEHWAEWYATRLQDRAQARNPIEAREWREALGDIKRAGDWSAFFARTLTEQPWREALSLWAPRLLPGIIAGATHGFLRTAHAVRSLERGESKERIAELSDGMAYWAARYQELPSAPKIEGTLAVAEALPRIDLLEGSRRGRFLIFDAVRALDAESFGPAINLVRADAGVDAFVSNLTRTFARQYLANAGHAAIGFVHTVTAPSALRFVAPYLDAQTTRMAMRYAWQACAAIYATYARPADAPAYEMASVESADLIEQAVAARDEHAIKFTEACLREYGASGDGVFLTAAQDAVRRLRAA